MTRKLRNLEGLNISARDGVVGHISDVYFEDPGWRVRYCVVKTGSWLTGRTVLLAPEALIMQRDAEPRMLVNLTKDQVRNSPSADTEKPISRQYEEELHAYYGWTTYWSAPAAGGVFMTPMLAAGVPAPTTSHPEDRSGLSSERLHAGGGSTSAALQERGAADQPLLRSARAIRGNRIEAADGSVGHVDDFLIDEAQWLLQGIIVDTRNWWPGKKVLITTPHITEMDWQDRKVYLDLTMEQIKSAALLEQSAAQ